MSLFSKIYNWFAYTGLWSQPIFMYGLCHLMNLSLETYPTNLSDWLVAFMLSALPSLYIWSLNSTAKRNGKEKFGFFDTFFHELDPSYQSSALEERAKRPIVHKEYCSDKPEGILFGTYKGQYVCKPVNEDGHVIVIGGSGSGKSSAIIIPTLICNPDVTIFAIDIKGELSFKSRKLNDNHTVVFNPDNRSSYGYDPFYRITKESSEQEILDCMEIVAASLITIPADIKDPYWKMSARKLLTGFLIFYYKHGINNLPDMCKAIIKKPMKNVVEDVLNRADENGVEMYYLSQFKGLADETFSGIASEVALHITIFATNQNIIYALRDNPLKMNPKMLEENGKCLFLSIKEAKLTPYYDLLQMVINQTLSELEQRPEDANQILVILDELPRLLSQGKLDKLLDSVKTLRSRKVTLILVTQSVDGLLSAYRESEVDDLISNCTCIEVLSASTVKTQDKVVGWAGQYKERKISYNDAGGKNQKRNISYEDKDIVDKRDLITLPKSDEAILIVPNGYFRIKKAPYYIDNNMRKKASEIHSCNEEIRRMEQPI